MNFLSSQAMAFLKLEKEHPDAINDGYPAKITPELLANPTFEMAVECMGDAAKMGHLTPIAVVRVKQAHTLDSDRNSLKLTSVAASPGLRFEAHSTASDTLSRSH